ncbi:MAG: hypothetical protein HOI53_08990, partial [Francisellaceae bacterium]|nr:hypothetical protein [Francisellaceae bacterium]
MLMPMVQQVISKCQTEHKLWDQTLYNGPQVLIIDGPIDNSSMLDVAKSISRMLQYNYPGIESTVINATNSPGIDFVAYRILNNCNSDLVSIVCGADVKLLQSKLKSHSFRGKIKTVLLYENVDSFFKT